MITKYSIYKLLIFFKHESLVSFGTIKKVQSIIDSEAIKEENKKEMILQVLRNAGLVEEDYRPEVPDEVYQEIERRHALQKSEQDDDFIIPVDVFEMKLLNVNIRTVIIVN